MKITSMEEAKAHIQDIKEFMRFIDESKEEFVEGKDGDND